MGKENCSQCGKELVSGEAIRCVYCDLNQVKEVGDVLRSPASAETNCGKCNLFTIRDKDSLHCELCKKWYHNGCNEFALDDRYCSLIYEAPKNITWFCDKCVCEKEKWITSFNVKKEVIPRKKRKAPRKRKTPVKRARSTRGKIKHNCDKCPKSFYDTQIFEAHKLWHIGDKRPYKCQECDKGFITKRKLGEHTDMHYNKLHNICDDCGKGFKEEDLLKSHMAEMHSKVKPYSCPKCNYRFKREKGFTKHIQTCKGPIIIKCSQCDYKTKRQGAMKAHMRSHTEEKVYVCSECGCRLKSLDGLKIHRATHSFEKPFECVVCGKGFKQKATLQMHMVVHNQNKELFCPVCGNGFASKEKLDMHVKTIHSLAEQPFSCGICGNKYKTKHYLKIHQRSGTCNATNLATNLATNTQKQAAIKYLQKPKPPIQNIASDSNNSNDSVHYQRQYTQQPPPLMVYTGGNNAPIIPPVYSNSHVTATIHCPPPSFSVYNGHYMS